MKKKDLEKRIRVLETLVLDHVCNRKVHSGFVPDPMLNLIMNAGKDPEINSNSEEKD